MIFFTDKLVFEKILYKVTSKIIMIFEIVICLHQITIIGGLVIHGEHCRDTDNCIYDILVVMRK